MLETESMSFLKHAGRIVRINVQLNLLLRIRQRLQHSNMPGRNFLQQCLRSAIHFLSGCDISIGAIVPTSTRFPHPTGIVIGDGVRLGERVTIYQNVTLGSHGRPGAMPTYPIVDDDCTLFAGCVLIGDITLGKGAIVGANSVLTQSLDDRQIAVGVPARVIIAGDQTSADDNVGRS